MSRELRGPNEKLGTVLALAGISNAGLARRVNDLGSQRGLTLRYDKTSVARWVSKGMVPQGAAPHLIAAAIGAKLGRPVPLHEIGLADADPAPEVGLAFPRDVGEAVRSATDLYRLDLAGGGRQRGHLAVAGRFLRGQRVRHARFTVADIARRLLGRAGRGDGRGGTESARGAHRPGVDRTGARFNRPCGSVGPAGRPRDLRSRRGWRGLATARGAQRCRQTP